MSAIWRISLSNLSRNLLEATELANVLQEVSSSIQVTGLSSSHSARTSSSASGNLTQLTTRERIKSALPLHIGAATVPWEQLVAVVSSDALQEPPSPYAGDKQPQLVEVNTGGSVFFLFFKLTREQYLQQLQLLQQRQEQEQQLQKELKEKSTESQDETGHTGFEPVPIPLSPPGVTAPTAAADPKAAAVIEELAAAAVAAASGDSGMPGQIAIPSAPMLANIASQISSSGPYVREGVAVLKVGFNRLAMQAEQFANELTRHLGIAAPDCRIVRQVGCTADEWLAATASVNKLANCCLKNTEENAPNGSTGGVSSVSTGGCGGCSGCMNSGDASELLAELSHLPCFLLMEYVEGDRLADCAHALEGKNLGVLLEDVGCLFLLDMLLGNADRMPCKRLGWRGNKNNLLYGAPGTRHEFRPVAIDSCVARRPPAQKASSEDAAVEQLAQLLLSVPEVSRSLLQQLLGNINRTRRTRVSRFSASTGSRSMRDRSSTDSSAAGSTEGSTPGSQQNSSGGCSASSHSGDKREQQQKCRTASRGSRTGYLQEQGIDDESSDLEFTDEDIARFQAGLRKCLTGVLQIKGLLEMVSSKTAEWIAEFVADVVRLNPAVLPSPSPASNTGPNGLPAPAFSPMRSPKPSPRPSMRSSLSSILQGVGGISIAEGSTVGPSQLEQQPSTESSNSGHSITRIGSSTTSYSTAGGAGSSMMPHSGADGPNRTPATLPPCPPVATAPADAQSREAAGTPSDEGSDQDQVPPLSPLASAAMHSSGGGRSSSGELLSGSAGGHSGHTKAGGSPVGKTGLLSRRAVSHLGFASIKAAICSHPNITISSPSTNSTSTPLASSPGDHSGSSAPPSNVVETAVAAALSPRANKAQAQALAGVFGGGGLVNSDGGIGVNYHQPKPYARRLTWGSLGEGERAAKVSPRELFPTSPPAAEDLPPAHGSHSGLRAASATSILYSHHHYPHSSHGSHGFTGPHSISSGGPSGAYSTSLTFPPQLARHLSFQGSQASGGAAAAGVGTTGQQHSSSSSLQVLASIQLDATLASIKYEARHDGALAERMAHWKAVFREKGTELSEAIAAWQARHHLAAVLSTGFLDGSHPIVDVYELGVRLQHMLRRLTALAAGAMVQAPICVLPNVFLGNAVAADSHHLLQYLGVTHVVNAAQELQVEAAPGLFQMYRASIRDEEEENISAHFHAVQTWIDAALSAGGAVLVHCHEGKSRSVALLLAYLMISKGRTLKSAMDHVKSVRPEASPNAGFMNQLMMLDLELHGAASMCRKELPRAKPEARVCSICGKAAGISAKSLDMHVKRAHGKPAAEAVNQGTAVTAESTDGSTAAAGEEVSAVQL